jgi:hypothetical protein
MVMNGRRPGAEKADHGKNSKPSACSKSTERARRSQPMTAVRGRMEVSAAISARPNPTDNVARSRKPTIVSSGGASSILRLGFGKGEGRAFIGINRRPPTLLTGFVAACDATPAG